MAQVVGQHQVATFTDPQNGQSPIDATQVRTNDNALRGQYVDHDADPGIHLQSSALASRPAAGTAGRKWLTMDAGSYRLFVDDGSNWQEVTYLRTDANGTVTGNLTVTGNVVVEGDTTLGNANTDAVTVTGRVASNVEFGTDDTHDVGASGANRPRTVYAGTSVVTPLVTATTLGGTLSTAAQTNITSVGTLSALTVSGDLTVDTDTLKVDSANNRVGIGTATPGAPLEVVGETRSRDGLSIMRSTSSAYLRCINPGLTLTGGRTDAISIGNQTADALIFHTADTERASIDASGNVGIGVTPTSRNNTRLQIVDGIGFPVTQVASSDANTLDDYEEGTYTATLTPGTSGSISLLAAFNELSYTKVGRLVTVTGYLIVTSVSSPVGNIALNLPFTPATLTDRAGDGTGVVTVAGTTSAPSSQFVMRIFNNNANATIYLQTGAAFLDTSANQIQNNTEMALMISYVSAT